MRIAAVISIRVLSTCALALLLLLLISQGRAAQHQQAGQCGHKSYILIASGRAVNTGKAPWHEM